MSTLKFDFRHYYQRGERRESDPIAYQYDLGHTLAIYVPVSAAYELHYSFPDYTESADYAAESIGAADDGGGGYKLTAHVPNVLFEREGELRVHIVGSADNHIITTYEGYITIRQRVQPDDYTDDDPENGAQSIIQRAKEYADESEAWAVGKIDGVDVPSTADQYHNNSKYYSEQSSSSATTAASQAILSRSYAKGDTNTRTGETTDNAEYYKTQAAGSASAASGSATAASNQALKSEGYAVGKQNGTDVASGSDYYHNNASYYSGQASSSATAAAGSADTAANQRKESEAWAVGKKDGTDVPSSADQYHNNAKYWADQALAYMAQMPFAYYDSTDESIVFRSNNVASYDATDESISINI